MQLTFDEIWRGIDNLARFKGISVSGLAGKAGLNPTTFNRSKRITPDGHKRWPTTESLNRVLEAAGVSAMDFLVMASDPRKAFPKRTLPMLGLNEAEQNAALFDDSGIPDNGEAWDGIEFPEGLDENAYVLEVSGNAMEPVYRDGDRLIIQPTTDIRKGDRIVLKMASGEILVKELKHKSAYQVELKSFCPSDEDVTFNLKDVLWTARILWVSQ